MLSTTNVGDTPPAKIWGREGTTGVDPKTRRPGRGTTPQNLGVGGDPRPTEPTCSILGGGEPQFSHPELRRFLAPPGFGGKNWGIGGFGVGITPPKKRAGHLPRVLSTAAGGEKFRGGLLTPPKCVIPPKIFPSSPPTGPSTHILGGGGGKRTKTQTPMMPHNRVGNPKAHGSCRPSSGRSYNPFWEL